MEDRYGRLTDLLELAGLMKCRMTGISIKQIAERFDVSRRTAERMLSALRERFPELEPEMRDGHKYWRLPYSSPIGDRIPEEFEILTQRITQLEADLENHEVAEEQLRAISEDVLGTSAVGVFVLDSDFRVVWVNQAIETYFGIRSADVIGQDKRRLIHERIRSIFAEPVEFEQRVIATYDDNSYIENFECHIVANGSRQERWLEHWSQPIEKGPYAGGRIEHYVNITALVAARAHSQEAPEITARAPRSFSDPLAELQNAADTAIQDGADPTATLARISSMIQDIRRAAELSKHQAPADATEAEPIRPSKTARR